MHILGTHRICTTSLHRSLKSSLKAQGDSAHWCRQLPLVLLGLRSAVEEELNCSPAELVYGSTLRLPGDFFPQVIHKLIRTLQPTLMN
ncbi:unnamed protein product [Ixodes pacificus]